jgi:hypothetical protein
MAESDAGVENPLNENSVRALDEKSKSKMFSALPHTIPEEGNGEVVTGKFRNIHTAFIASKHSSTSARR